MTGSLALLLAAGAVRLIGDAVLSWLGMLRDLSRRRSLETLLRAAGPEVTMMDRCSDGGVLAIWTRGPGESHHRSEPAR
jgi:hypothetical protein